jgi:hypothetical protein
LPAYMVENPSAIKPKPLRRSFKPRR